MTNLRRLKPAATLHSTSYIPHPTSYMLINRDRDVAPTKKDNDINDQNALNELNEVSYQSL